MNLADIQASLPDSKLRADNQWLFSPRPLQLSKGENKRLEKLGSTLAAFQKASESIYQRSAKGRLPRWISELLDAGKPSWLVEAQRSAELRDVLPRVIRPDLILTEDGFSLTELDSVPGGMGILQWLNQTYVQHGFDVLGGKDGMLEGFRSLMPDGGRILISEESVDYQPEMQWLSDQLGDRWPLAAAENDAADEGAAYRFFEWFDWQNIPAAKELARKIDLTSPCKPHLEEKLWLALLWSPGMRGMWSSEMRGSNLQRMRELVPHGWVVDPAPLPPQAALPKLHVQSWQEVSQFSQKDRRLVLKISGFDELAWGSRGVFIGHDMPGHEWADVVSNAAEQFSTSPWMMQEFHNGRVIDHPYFDPSTGEEKIMTGRARLCPYYFVGEDGKTQLGGCLATIVPADKKKIHGMKDGILVPCAW